MKHRSTKSYPHELGLSACFRQWRATSHCRYLHGYALAFRFEFGANELDERNWVVDFGALKSLKEKLCGTFDHKLIVAKDDPLLRKLVDLDEEHKVADVLVLPAVGCEAFAAHAHGLAVQTLRELGLLGRVRVLSCECSEHGANSAIYKPEEQQ